MRKTSARLMVLAASAALVATPIAASAKPDVPTRSGSDATRTQTGDNVNQRKDRSRNSVESRYRSDPFSDGSLLLFFFLAFGT